MRPCSSVDSVTFILKEFTFIAYTSEFPSKRNAIDFELGCLVLIMEISHAFDYRFIVLLMSSVLLFWISRYTSIRGNSMHNKVLDVLGALPCPIGVSWSIVPGINRRRPSSPVVSSLCDFGVLAPAVMRWAKNLALIWTVHASVDSVNRSRIEKNSVY